MPTDVEVRDVQGYCVMRDIERKNGARRFLDSRIGNHAEKLYRGTARVTAQGHDNYSHQCMKLIVLSAHIIHPVTRPCSTASHAQQRSRNQPGFRFHPVPKLCPPPISKTRPPYTSNSVSSSANLLTLPIRVDRFPYACSTIRRTNGILQCREEMSANEPNFETRKDKERLELTG